MEEAIKKESLKNYELISINSEDGLKLIGKLFRKKNKEDSPNNLLNNNGNATLKRERPRGVVIAVHGYHSGGIRDMGRFAELYSRINLDYLIVSQRAHEESQGTHITFGAKESKDVIAWIKKIRLIYGGEIPIILHGASMGAASVIMAAGSKELNVDEDKLNVICCIADSPYKDILTQARYLMQDKGNLSQKLNIEVFKAYLRATSHVDIKATSPIKASSNLEIPLLLIHGKNDRLIPSRNSESIYKAVKHQNKKVVYIEGAGHVCSYVVSPQVYEREFTNFINRFI